MKRSAVVGITAGAAVLLVGGAATAWLMFRPPSAEDAAHRYLTALSTGDFATIDAMRAAPLAEDAERVVRDAFAGADAYVADPRVEQITDGDGVAAVRASATIGGSRRDVSFVLGRQSGDWQLSGDYLASVQVEAVLTGTDVLLGDSVWLGDALAPANAPVAVLPAEYPVQPAPRGLLSGASTVGVSNDEPVTVRIDAAVATAAAGAAQEQLDAYADACAQPAAAVPGACGLRIPWAADLVRLDGVAFRIEQRPQLALSPDGRTFAATGGVIVATATGTARDGTTARHTYRADDWALRGSVTFQGDEMVLGVG